MPYFTLELLLDLDWVPSGHMRRLGLAGGCPRGGAEVWSSGIWNSETRLV